MRLSSIGPVHRVIAVVALLAVGLVALLLLENVPSPAGITHAYPIDTPGASNPTPQKPAATPTTTIPVATATATPFQEPSLPVQPPPPPTPTPLPPGVVVGRITPDGGAVIDAYKEDVRITFPPGAVSFPTDFVYTVVKEPPAGAPPQDGSRLYFTLEALSTNGNPVTGFNAEFEICAKNATALTYFDGKKWVDIPVTPTVDGVCGHLNHLTLFAVVVGATPTPGAGGAPGVAGPASEATPAAVSTATPTRPAVPSQLPSTGGVPPLTALLAFAGAALAIGLMLRRAQRT